MTWYWIRTWLRNLVSVKAGTSLLSAFGTLWLGTEIAAYFFDGTEFASTLRSLWWLFLILGIANAAYLCRPDTKITAKLAGRDVQIELAIGDIFKLQGSLIVGSNTTFDTRVSRQLISEKSIQGQFTRKYYGNDETPLDAELDRSLQGIPTVTLPPVRVGKDRRFPLGSVARLNPRDRTAYFVAIADINEHGVASGSFESVKIGLASLWVYIAERGLKENLLVPILGSGFTRIPTPREEVIREIIKSFVAACSQRVFADKLTIVIRPTDLMDSKMSFEDLGRYLHHVCTYTTFPALDQLPAGEAEA